ncbi:hypothetical protein PROFUN_00756 [Planoprotostelium fungivorum]|uniref:Uncharacterized protein n=1 Tax=Planoprotostelium fungivorum TaxID=1890364 RepID=A0A2P6NU96_9EUKA|nr:hypothetical protein PROFUN_00756 [Planoprotostelium fungivorum]
MGSQLEQSLQSNRRIGVKLVDASDSHIASIVPSHKLRAFELLRCFNFIMESLGRENMMLLSRGRYEDMLHQIEHTYNSSELTSIDHNDTVSSIRSVLIRNSNVILPVKERLKDLLVSLINAHKPNDGYTTAWVDAAVDKIDAAGDGKISSLLANHRHLDILKTSASDHLLHSDHRFSMAAQTPKDLLVSLINAHKPNDGYTTAWVDAAVDKIDAAGDGKVRNWILKIQNSTPGFVADYIALKNSIDAAAQTAPAGSSSHSGGYNI